MINKIIILIFILFLTNVYSEILQYKWMYFKPYGSTVYLQSLYNDTQCIASQCYWLLPDKYTRLNYPYPTNQTSKYSILSNGTLIINNIQENDNGIYHFFKINGSNWIVSKALLNLHGAPFDSIWLEYWPNVVGGLVAMAVVFITFTLILLADKYRYRPPITRPVSTRPGTVVPINQSVGIERTNPIFTNDDNDTITSEKRRCSRRSSSISNGTELRVEQF